MKPIKLLVAAIIVLLVISYSALPCYSQRTEGIYFDKIVPVDSYSYYNRLRVIDNRADKQTVGARVNMVGKRTDLITVRPLDTTLSMLFAQTLGSLHYRKIAKRELLFILEDIVIEEPAIVKFAGDFYSGENEMYRYLGRVDTFLIMNDEWPDVVANGKNIVSATMAAFAATAPPQEGVSYTEVELLQKKRNERLSFPIYRDAPAFKKGVYYTVEQFLNNDPVDTPIVIKEYTPTGEPRQLYVYYVTGNKSKKAVHLRGTEFFAAYNGTIWVSATYKGYSKMEFLNGEFYATKPYVHKVPVNYKDILALGRMYGAVGGLINGLAISVLPPDKRLEDALIYFRSRFDPLKKEFIPIRYPR